jgi:hypothetical protein
MKLPFDHNLSPQLVNRFTDLYPDSQHVFLLGMDQDDDRQIWEYAAQQDFTIVTRDSNYNDLSLFDGISPKSHLDLPRQLLHPNDRKYPPRCNRSHSEIQQNRIDRSC